MTAREHARLLGLFFWIFAGFQLLMTAFSGIFMFVWMGFVIPQMMQAQQRGNHPPPPPEFFFGFMAVIMIFAVIMAIIMLIPKIVAGYGLRNEKSWAKIWAIIGCCLAVLNVPFGTALGVYGFWFIFGDQGKAYFDNNYSEKIFTPPPPQNWQ